VAGLDRDLPHLRGLAVASALRVTRHGVVRLHTMRSCGGSGAVQGAAALAGATGGGVHSGEQCSGVG
jgi:hypothetical protein